MRRVVMLTLILPFCGCYTVLRTSTDAETPVVQIEISVGDRWTQYEAGEAWWQKADDENAWTLPATSHRYGRRDNISAAGITGQAHQPPAVIGYYNTVVVPAINGAESTSTASTSSSNALISQKETPNVESSKKNARVFGTRSSTTTAGKKNQ